MNLGINVTILPESEIEAIKAVEVLSRAAAGLALEGITVSINLSTFEDD